MCVDPGDRPQDKAKSGMRNITRAATCSAHSCVAAMYSIGASNQT
jgi:hypothetical protein